MQPDPVRYTPTIRAALRAALGTPSHTLMRTRGGFVTSQPNVVQPFTRRTINRLERDGLAAFDQPECPSAVTLTDAGIEAAKRIERAQSARGHRT